LHLRLDIVVVVLWEPLPSARAVGGVARKGPCLAFFSLKILVLRELLLCREAAFVHHWVHLVAVIGSFLSLGHSSTLGPLTDPRGAEGSGRSTSQLYPCLDLTRLATVNSRKSL
jgi:hypothetical protein